MAERLPRRKELLSPQTPHRRLLRFCWHIKQKDTSSKCQANKKSQAADNQGWGKCKTTVTWRPRKKKSVVRREGGRRGKAREGTDQQRERRCNTTQQSALLIPKVREGMVQSEIKIGCGPPGGQKADGYHNDSKNAFLCCVARPCVLLPQARALAPRTRSVSG